jgi:hypothetical protein
MIPPKFFVLYLRAKNGSKTQSATGRPELTADRLNPDLARAASLYDLRVAKEGEIVWVQVSDIRNRTSVALSQEQNHFVRYFRDGRQSLERFYELHQPRSALDHVFLKSDRLDGTQPSQPIRVFPWSNIIHELTSTGFPKSQWFGPVNDDFLNHEVTRLDRVFHSVTELGFRAIEGDLPTYTLMINDEGNGEPQYRVIGEGQGTHRTAFLSYLGWPLIPLTPDPSVGPAEVRLASLGNWPGVLDGEFSVEEAREIFLAFFREPHDILLSDW